MNSFAVWVLRQNRPGSVFMLVALGVGITVGPMQGQTISFFRPFSTPGMDRATAVAVDTSGIYVIGNRANPQGDQGSAAVRKYDPLGNELWTREFSVSAGASVTLSGAAADASGVYVVGFSGTADLLRKYSADGNELWTRQLDFTPLYVAVDASGVYVAGRDFPPNFSYLRKYSPDGAELWTSRFGDPNDLHNPYGMAMDATGVYVAGMRFYPGAFPFVRKWDSSGNELWNHQLGASADPTVGIAADSTGFYILGGTDGGFTLSKYDPAGNERWTRQFATSSRLYPSAVAADDTGVYVVGRMLLAGPVAPLTAMPGQCRSGSGGDSFVRRYDRDGAELWTREFGGSQATWASSVAVDAGGVYVVGADGTAQVRDWLELLAVFQPAFMIGCRSSIPLGSRPSICARGFDQR